MNVGRGLMGLWLTKELRLLRLPAVVAAVAALLGPILNLYQASAPGQELYSLLRDFAWFGFLGCILLIASAPIGWEFQHRTLAMMLVQPVTRQRVWAEKMLAPTLWNLGLLIWVVAVDFMMSFAPAKTGWRPDFGFLLLFAPATLCAAPVWTLLARSTVGGVTFTAISHFLGAILVNYLAGKLRVNEGVAFFSAFVLYCVVFLRWGRRIVASTQLTDGVVWSGASDLEALPAGPHSPAGSMTGRWFARFTEARWLDRALRCTPGHPTANLFRKEVRLQKPVFLLGIIFAAGWLAILILSLLQPGKGYPNLFDVLIAFFVPLTFLLAGSVSISDDNTLGVAGWHLTLPVRAQRQWAVKLVSSAGAAAVVGWILPVVCSLVTGLLAPAGFTSRWLVSEPGIAIVCVSATLFIMSFWAVGLVGNTMQAVMLALLSIVALFFAFLTCSRSFSASRWASHGFVFGHREFLPYIIGVSLLLLAAIALGQTLLLYRRPDAVRKPLIVYPAVLLLGAALMGVIVSLFGV